MSTKPDKDYFDNLHSRIMDKVDAMPDELEKNAPVLFGMKGKNCFHVPDYYFSELSQKILKSSQKQRTIRLSFYRVAAAASVALILYFGIAVFNSFETNHSLAENDIMEYYLDNSYLLDYEMLDIIEEEMADESISYFEGLEDEALEEYISTVIDQLSDTELAMIEEI